MSQTFLEQAKEAASDLARLIRFYSRLPAPKLPFEAEPHAPPDFSRAPRLLPYAGALIGLTGALVLWIASSAGLGPGVSAILAIATLVIATGAFHEDGLADTADGLWGGATVERRLEIMKDSRIGTYGGAALVLSLLLRAAALAAILDRTGAAASALMIIASASYSRVCGLLPLTLLEPARPDGAAAGVGRPTMLVLASAFAGAVAIGVLLGIVALMAGPVLVAMALALAAAGGITLIARAKIGGQTGDIAGAAQQAAEMAFLIGLLGSL